MHTPPHLLLNLYAYVPLSNLSGWACALPDRETAGPGWVAGPGGGWVGGWVVCVVCGIFRPTGVLPASSADPFELRGLSGIKPAMETGSNSGIAVLHSRAPI